MRIWSCFAVIGDWVPEDVRLKKTVGRMATYLQAYGDLMVRTNGWDPAVLERFRADPFVAGFRGAIDGKATTAELEHVATLIPEEWLAAAGYGTPEQCARAVLHQMDLGADSVILHGVSPTELAPVVEAYRDAPRHPLRPPPRQPRRQLGAARDIGRTVGRAAAAPPSLPAMFLAWHEMRRSKLRFGLLTGAVGLLVFLILFQQALLGGLITQFIGAVRNQSA
ncbi:MAG: hypothetical protein R2694_12040 [Ilumatobacteraceae bacterium]